ncbi:nitrate reductase [Membranihabitans maritimus]|uniref:nitrate reductase n=1 Tax=Membranihabitans maritimus TaxID=2904244 RepID=UPI001F388CD9|nr:nitrate reductase [Membranihabitans maritimus]
MNTPLKTTCSYCGVGCGIEVSKDQNNRVLVKGDENHPVNRGMLCSKGRNLHHVVNDTSDRILYPQMRWSRSHPMERVQWDAALNRATAVFKSLINKYGPDSVGFYVSGQCLTEEYYIANKLCKGFLGTNNIDTNSRLCMSSAVMGYKKTFGEDSVPGCYEDIELADCFVIAGANPAWCHPILFRRLEQHKEKNPDVKIIVVDPRKTDTAAMADLHLPIIPGTDIVLYHAIGKQLLKRGLIDYHFIKNHTQNFESYTDHINKVSIKRAAAICGISINDLKLAADWIGKSEGFISMWAMGLNQSIMGTDKNFALLSLSLLTGQVGKPGSGPFSLTGQPNAMGGREVGGMASLLAAHKDLSNPEHRNEVSAFWGGKEISGKPGYTATEMFDALEKGNLKAIWIVCTNPMVSLPDSRKVERALKKAKFVIVQDISHHSDTTQFADLLLPAAGWLEKEGTMTNSERRISYLPKGINPPGEALPDVEILCRFAQKMGYKGFDYSNNEEIYKEYSLLTKNTNIDISYLNYDRLRTEGTFQWPVPDYKHPGTKRLFTDNQFYTSTKKAIFNIPAQSHYQSPKEDDDFPLILTTGRIRDQWHTMTKTGKVSRLKKHYSKPVLDINPVDAYINRLKDGDVVEVKSKNGVIRVRCRITNKIREGVVFIPMHWGKQLNYDLNRANNVTEEKLDPISKEPDFKYTMISVTKYKKPVEKIYIIGAGAASFRFVQNYREQNSTDEIHVFSGEANPFYNRVLLPEYISDDLTWDELVKIKKEELNKLNIILHSEIWIHAINRSDSTILDSLGNLHNYDRLIIATGSKANAPMEVPIHAPGRFTLRKREDAEYLKKHLFDISLPPEEKHVVIVGGGLLGLELAAALKKTNIRITIVQRGSRLMERQLDGIASKILAENVQNRSIKIYFDNEVSTVFDYKDSRELMITLKSGKILQSHAIVYAIGTQPNIGIARKSKLRCGRGIKVNQYLQTSDPSIFAIGEIAEFRDEMYGITAAAEEQASILANFIAGDVSSIYRGSIPMNILKFQDFKLCSIGKINTPKNDDSYEEIVLMDIRKSFYKKCIVKNDCLVGAILIGDNNEFAEFKSLIEDKTELSDKREKLLRGNGPQKEVKGQLVCSCNSTGAGNIKEAIEGGCLDFNELCAKTGAGLGCGSCKPEVKEILNEALFSV